ncbi:uncharacterized protein LOC119661242 [Hermetia illucens]|uniref:uncharacterized protein LOC119661242 n=1 Tax=Hermetia illucens TaxID=343691 RepID=UPI0018CC384E|nr:uncharacterized protein LOC119661242 [Hermetia illucens]XP_037926400.1 uncharacterized protein LOC119661242 [Hermetia illucens]XP_037926401.1 uncharacterized protein LOC119661242 [Hermetia illucens]
MSAVDKCADDFSAEEEIKNRRLARRKKILENAKSRLDKLNGKGSLLSSGEDAQQRVPAVYPDPEVEQELFNNMITTQTINRNGSSGLNVGSPEGIFSLLEHLVQNSYSDRNNRMVDRTQSNVGTASASNPPQQLSDSILNRVIHTKVHIALISALTFMLFVTDNEKYISYSIFLPLLFWEIAEAFLIKAKQFTTAGFLLQIMLLAALPSQYLMPITKAVSTLNKIFEDVGVFVFFFVLYHLCYYSFARNLDLNA